MGESDKLAEKIGIVALGGQVTIHTVNLGQSIAAPPAPESDEILPQLEQQLREGCAICAITVAITVEDENLRIRKLPIL